MEAIYLGHEKGEPMNVIVHVVVDEDEENERLMDAEEYEWEILLPKSNKPVHEQARLTIDYIKDFNDKPFKWFRRLGGRSATLTSIQLLYHSGHPNSELLARQYAWRAYKKLTDCPTYVH
jgi:hypothetical protein